MEISPLTPNTCAPRRPVGVVIGAVTLAMMGCLIFIAGCLMFVAAAILRNSPVQHLPPFVTQIQILTGIFLLFLAGVCGAVAVGLFKRRNWARVSVTIIGVFEALVCFLASALYVAISTARFPVPPAAPPVDPHIMRMAMFCLSGGFLLAAGVGVWWAIYFNLRRIRLWFTTPAVLVATETGDAMESLPAGVEPAPGRGTVKILLIALTVTMIFGALTSIVFAANHAPLFLAGAILRGKVALISWLTLAVLNIGIGIGLLRRDKVAWYGACLLQAHAVVAWIGMLLPHSHERMLAYQQEVQQSFALAGAAPSSNPFLEGPAQAVGAVFGLLFIGAIVWLLVLARPLFFPAQDA